MICSSDFNDDLTVCVGVFSCACVCVCVCVGGGWGGCVCVWVYLEIRIYLQLCVSVCLGVRFWSAQTFRGELNQCVS